MRDILALVAAAALPVPWLLCHHGFAVARGAEVVAVLSGLAILGGAFLLAWATELAERDIPQSLAILALALVSVLPEYAVDLHFAWTAGKDPSYAQYAVANMTGANRLLIGLGWAVVVLLYCWRAQAPELRVDRRQRLEIRFLVWATLYSFTIPLSGTISLLDAAVLLLLFALYAASAMRGDSEEVELVGPPALIERRTGDVGRRAWALSFFAFAIWAIFISAEPFADGLVEVGRSRDINEFLLVQWIAPLASESPEFLVASLFALRLRGSVGIGALISSKVNQWTLLVGAIPIAFCLSSGGWSGLPLDARQSEEMILTSAQSLFASVVIADLRFTRAEALGLASLFGAQFLFPGTTERYYFTGLYLALTAVLLASAQRRRDFFGLVFSLPASDR
ncbi:MAG: sodium:calcium antiporter [Deltaproteobacteria bacterium]|nr:sodium:calcium antiporter [Deltaproteobacteria bacterium]